MQASLEPAPDQEGSSPRVSAEHDSGPSRDTVPLERGPGTMQQALSTSKQVIAIHAPCLIIYLRPRARAHVMLACI